MSPATSRARQSGFSLVAAIFILVVLALLGTFMVTIGQVSRSTAVGALQAARVYYAARAGIELGVYRVLNTPPGTACALAPATVDTGPFTLSGPGLDGFQVTVSCSYTSHQERNTPIDVYAITSTATFGTFGGDSYVSRSIFTTATNAP